MRLVSKVTRVNFLTLHPSSVPQAGYPMTVACSCSRSNVKRFPGLFCGPNNLACRNTDGAGWVDGADTVVEGFQGSFPSDDLGDV